MRRFNSNWLNHEILMMPGFFFEGEGSGGGGAGDGEGGGEGGAGSGDTKTYDEAYVKQLRGEAAANRKKAAELEAKLKERETADLSELEKAQREAKDATEKLTATETRARARLAKSEVVAAATKLKFHDPAAAYKLISDDVEFDDEGEPKNVAKLIEQLAKDKPWMVDAGVKTSPANPGGGSGGGSGNSRPSWKGVFK